MLFWLFLDSLRATCEKALYTYKHFNVSPFMLGSYAFNSGETFGKMIF